MLDLSTCLVDIVGLSENDCACFGEDEPILGDMGGGDVLGGFGDGEEPIIRPDNWNTSLSGFYLDDQKYSVPLKFTASSKDCGDGNVWDVLVRSRNHGYRNFLTDLGASIKNIYNRRLHKFSGSTAGTSHNSYVSGLKTYAGVYIDPHQYRGAKGTIDEIELYITGSGSYEVNIYSEDDFDTPVNAAPIEVVVVANYGKKKLDTPISLSFSDQYARKVGYYLVYDRQGVNPRNIQFDCNCGNAKPWGKHFTLYGVSADALTGLVDSGRNTQSPYGVRLKMQVNCGLDWLCRSWDFSEQWDRVAAECMWLYGICDLLERQLNDPQPVSTVSPEIIQKKIDNVKLLLSQRMPWLGNNMPIEESDCYTCKQMYEVNAILI